MLRKVHVAAIDQAQATQRRAGGGALLRGGRRHDPRGRPARRTAGRPTDQVRTPRQSQNGKGARHLEVAAADRQMSERSDARLPPRQRSGPMLFDRDLRALDRQRSDANDRNWPGPDFP